MALSRYDRPVVETPPFALRPGRREDFAFAEAIYIDAMRPMMVALGTWNEAERRAAFRRSYKTAETSIITLDGADIGWMQVSERDTDYNLAQVQLLPEYCGRGIGSRLIGDLLKRAARDGKTVSLAAVRTNRAIRLYERMGFRIIDPDATPIIDMVWEPGFSRKRVGLAAISHCRRRAHSSRARSCHGHSSRVRSFRARSCPAHSCRGHPFRRTPPPSTASRRMSSNMPVSTSMRMV